MKRPCQNSDPIEDLVRYPVKSRGRFFIGRLLPVLILTIVSFVFIFAIQIAEADIYSTAVSSVDPGWQNNRKRVLFYNGSRFFLIYSKGDGLIYYKSSPDNVDWTSAGESTLTGIDYASLFDIYLVSDTKFDVAYYRYVDQTRYVRTCTIDGATINVGDPSSGINQTIYSIAVARSGAGDGRIYLVGRYADGSKSGDLRASYANNPGDAANVTSWSTPLNFSDKGGSTKVAIVPYQGVDKALVVYNKDVGPGTGDGVFSSVISPSGAETEREVGNTDYNDTDFSSPISISDTDFRIAVKIPSGNLEEYKWNGVDAWSLVETIDTEIDQQYPSLFYDRISGDMYLFSHDTGTDDIERHYKPNGGSWQPEVEADGEPLLSLNSYPITQMHEPPYESTRIGPRVLVWGYRVVTAGPSYNLKVGTLFLAPGISSDANQVFEVGQAATPISPITITEADTPAITAANDLRIRIAPGVDMVWDTSDTTATFTGTASTKVSNPVSYDPSGKILIIPVDLDFAAGDTLIIEDLSFTTFNSASAAKVGLEVLLDGPLDTGVDAADDKTIAIKAAVTLANHTLGQVGDQFTGKTESATTTEYFQFQLDNNGERASTTLTVDLSSISGVFTGDVTNAELWADVDGLGDITLATAWSNHASGQTDDIFSLTFDFNKNVLYAGVGGSVAGDGIILRCDASTGCDAASEWTTSYISTENQIRSLTFDSSNNIIYAGSNPGGMIFRCDTSTGCDDTLEWTTSYDAGGSITSLTFDSINSVIYAGTSEIGASKIYRCDTSTGCDDTSDWTLSYSTTIDSIRSLTFDSTNGVIYAGTDESGAAKIYRCDTSTGCGSGDWTLSYTSGDDNIYSLTFDSTNNVVYAGSGNTSGGSNIFRCDTSTGCGSGDWTAISMTETYVWSLTFDSINNMVYAGTGNPDNIYSCYTATLCDAAADWSALPTSPYAAGGDVWSLTFDSTNNVIYGGNAIGDIIRKFEGDYKLFDGTPNIAGALGTIAFNAATILPAGAMDYLLRATISNIADGDTITFDLSPSGVVATGEVSGESLTVSDSSTDPLASITHTRGSALSAFGFRKSITIDRTKIPGTCGTTLTNFPMLFSVTDGDLKTTTYGGDVASYDAPTNDPRDIIFRALDDDTCSPGTAPCGLYHEIEKYDPTTGEIVAWVKIPSVNTNAASSDTVIYIYYGNSDVTTSSQNANAVWDDNYVGVWHLQETSGDHADSTSNYTGTPAGGVNQDGTGQIDGADDFGGSDGEVRFSDAIIGDSAAFTITAWIKMGPDTSDQRTIYGEGDTATTEYLFLYVDDSTNNVRFYSVDSASNWAQIANGTTNVEDNQFHHVAMVQRSKTNRQLYVDTVSQGTDTRDAGTLTLNTASIGYLRTTWVADPFLGVIDEVRVSNIDRSTCWIAAEYNNQIWPDKAVTPTPDPSPNPDSGFYTVGGEEPTPATAVSLASFTAKGNGNSVLVEWETAQELNHMGFYLYRAQSPWGPFNRLTDKLISSLTSSVVGRKYSFENKDVTPGEIYYYQLEDLDIYGKKTLHGPICVDWDGDGLPDDWEIAHGLNPGFDDADLDWDGDGLTNLQEYLRGTDPFNPDTDGDGILDGDEGVERDPDDQKISAALGPGVYLVASDEAGVTLELRTDTFDFDIVQAEGQEFERLRIKDYIHGFTDEVGKPELPLKGILVDIPDGSSATLRVLETEAEVHTGYRIYPVPETVVDDQGELSHVGETFVIDKGAYSVDAFYPDAPALLGKDYLFRGQQKQQIFFYPLTFNPATGELRHLRRIRVRVDYVAAGAVKTFGPEPTVWKPPVVEELSVDALSMVESAAWEPPSGASPVYKVLVSEEGIYRLTKTWLEARGVNVAAIDLSQVRIYNLGQEIAISVYDGNGDTRFDPEDYIDFYGRAVDDTYAKYTTSNVYWLTLEGGVGAPKRMAAIDGTPTSGSVPATHSFAVHHEEDRRYWARAPGDDALDRYFFDPYLYGEEVDDAAAGVPIDFNLFLPGVSGTAKGTLTIMMAGTWAPDHQVAVSLNGTPLETYSWNDIAFYEATIEGVDLVDGNNTVTLQCLTGVDAIAVDWFEVTYPRSFAANDDSLKFTYETGYLFQVSGFSTDTLMAFDITSPGEVERVINFQAIDAGGPGPYTLDFKPESAPGERTYLVLTSDQVKVPVAIIEDVYGNLANPAIGADYILITHRDIGWDVSGDPYPWLTDLVSLRQAQGLRVKVVDVEDVFDEFSYGIESPEAIRDLITYAYTSWTPPAPQYVLLVGDSTRNPKNNPDPSLGLDSVTTYIPAYLTFTEHNGESATDEWFVRVSGDDGISDLYIGRLPAKSAAEATIMVNKILTYEQSVNTKSWEKNVLLLADDQRDGPEYEYEATFELMNNDVEALLPQAMNDPFKGYLNDYFDADDLSAEIMAHINNGTLMVNYSGHSSVQILANHKVNYENIFNNTDVATLTNTGMYPLFVGMGCLSGNFLFPEGWNFPSLAEALLRAEDKGAIAVLMSTGQTTTEGQHILDSALFDAIFNQDVRVLGPAVSTAKQTLMANGDSTYEEVYETFLLFGDPVMTLKVPLPQRPQGLSAQGHTGGVSLSWNGSKGCNGNTVAGYNLYRSTTPGGPYTKVNTSLITGTHYDDTPASSTMAHYSSSAATSSGTIYYYVVTSVDGQGDESVYSQEASGGTQSANPSSSESSGGGGGGGGCFINTVTGN